jgi:hypothetical protein
MSWRYHKNGGLNSCKILGTGCYWIRELKIIRGAIIIRIPFRKFNLIMCCWLLIWQHSLVLAHTQKAQLILSQHSIWLHPCTVQLWSLTRPCEQTRNMYCIACHQFTLMLDVALRGTSAHFCHRERLFARMNAVPLYGLVVLCKVTSTVMFVHKVLFTPISLLPSSDGNIYKYMPRAFKRIFFISYGATFLAKR